MNTSWKEEYLNAEGKKENGSPEAEDIFFDEIAAQIREVVRHFEEDNQGSRRRANHAKILAGFTNAQFKILPFTPETNKLNVGFLQPGRIYTTTVRLSNASGESNEDDTKPDLRGISIRVNTDDGLQDFLMTNAEPHHARDAREAMIAIRAGVMKDIIADKIPDFFPGEEGLSGALGALPYMVGHMGLGGFRMASTLKKQMKLKVESLSTETFWSRAPIAIGVNTNPGNAAAIKFRLQPTAYKKAQTQITAPKNLEKELMEQLEVRDVIYYFEVQFYQDENTTPIEDSTITWPTPFYPIAELTIPKGSNNEKEVVDQLNFSPWNVDAQHLRPLGSMNRSRKRVYPASVDERKSQQ
jgi:catalase